MPSTQVMTRPTLITTRSFFMAAETASAYLSVSMREKLMPIR